MVSLIDDQVAVIRQNAFRIDSISQQQGMIDDDDMGMLCLGTDAVKRTLVFLAERTGVGTASLIFG